MMKAQSYLFLAASGIAVTIFMVFYETTSYSQDNNIRRPVPAVDPFGDVGSPDNAMTSPTNRYIKNLNNVRISQKLSKLRMELKNAKSSEQKDQAKKSVREALVEYFDGDMKQRRAELDRLTSRSDEMSAALKKRAEAKEKLVELQLKSFKYEADGLGLFPKQRGDSQLPIDQQRAASAFRPSQVHRGAIAQPAPRGQAGPVYAIRSVDVRPLKTAMNSVTETHKKLQSAKSKEDRTQATTELHKALSEYFDVDLKARQQEIDTINVGLKKMQAGLQKRAEAKDDIVDLQLQIIVNEAEGLGFFRKSASNSSHDDRLLMRSDLRSPSSVRRTGARRVAR